VLYYSLAAAALAKFAVALRVQVLNHPKGTAAWAADTPATA
jgi:hypothetical protein